MQSREWFLERINQTVTRTEAITSKPQPVILKPEYLDYYISLQPHFLYSDPE